MLGKILRKLSRNGPATLEISEPEAKVPCIYAMFEDFSNGKVINYCGKVRAIRTDIAAGAKDGRYDLTIVSSQISS